MVLDCRNGRRILGPDQFVCVQTGDRLIFSVQRLGIHHIVELQLFRGLEEIRNIQIINAGKKPHPA